MGSKMRKIKTIAIEIIIYLFFVCKLVCPKLKIMSNENIAQINCKLKILNITICYEALINYLIIR